MQFLRCSPQPVGLDEGRDVRVLYEGNEVSVDDTRGSFDAVFSAQVDDAAVIAQVKAQLLPLITARSNVTVVFSGHDGTGKTCLMEQLLPSVLDSLKHAIGSADEAHQEAVNIGDVVRGVRDRSVVSQPPVPTKSVGASVNAATVDTADTPHDTRRAAKTSARVDLTEAQSPSRGGPKYSLVLARLPRDVPSVELTRVEMSEGKKHHRVLLPKLELHVDDSSTSPVKVEASPSRWRMALERARSPQAFHAGALTSLGPKNGRTCGEHEFAQFGSGELTYEPNQELDKTLKDPYKVLLCSFWLIVDDPRAQQCVFHYYDPHDANFRFFVMLNTNDLGFEETGHVFVSLRDSHGKKLEATFCDCLEPGRWHHVELQIHPLDKSISLRVNDKYAKQKTSVSDNIGSFHEARAKVGLIGALSEQVADGSRVRSFHLQGSLMDFLVSEFYSGKKLVSFSLRGTPGLTDSTFSNGNLQGTVPFAPRSFPSTSPSFDGLERFINVGPVGDLGLMTSGTTFEVCFRTNCTSERMCLMGVQDSTGKNPGFSIELNANAQNLPQRYMMTFAVQDRAGASIRVTAELSSAFDDRWHTVSVRIADWDGRKFKIRLDGRLCDSNVHSSGTPHDFVSYTQYVTIGAFNYRGTVKRFFKGTIKSVIVTRHREEVDEPLASWLLNEGPGAVIAMDATSHGFHGIYFLKPGVKGACFFPSDLSDGNDAEHESGVGKGVVRYSNNMVTMAFCSVRTEVSAQSGLAQENMVDLLTGRRVPQCEEVELRSYNSRVAPCDSRVFKTIPEENYQRVTVQDYMATFKSAAGRLDDSKHSHTVFVLRLGDASFTVFDLASYKKTARAAFNSAQLTWTDALSLCGDESKVNFALNSALSKFDKLLLTCGGHPQLYKRSVFQRPAALFHSDSVIVNLAAFALLASKEPAVLVQMHLVSPRSRGTEVLQSILQVQRMRQRDRTHAAMVIQKLARWRKAYKRFKVRMGFKKDADARREKMLLLRKQFPKEILEKDKRIALVIACTEFEYDPSMPRDIIPKTDDPLALARLLEALGYKCEIMLNPSKKNLLDGIERKKQEQSSIDALLYVHIIGVCASAACFSQEPSLKVRLSWLADAERDARLSILSVQRKVMAEFYSDEHYEFNLLLEQLRANIEEEQRKNAKKKKKGNEKAAPPPTLPTRPPRPTSEAVAKTMAKWDTLLAPRVDRIVDSGTAADVPLPPLPEELVLCVGDTRAALSAANTVRVHDVQALLMSEAPRRGEHVIFSYDCVAYPSASNSSFGSAGMVAGSGESLAMEYKRGQAFLLTYYLKRTLQGCAAESVRIGKNDPPTQTSFEVAFRYLQKKLDPTEGQFPTRSLTIHWFGEFVGDVNLASKLLSKKEDRRKAKSAQLGKKSLAKLTFLATSTPKTEVKTSIQQRLVQLLKAPADVKKVSVADSFRVVLAKGDFNTLQQHELAKREITQALESAIPHAPRLKWFVQHDTAGVALLVCPLGDGDVARVGDPDASRDLKQQATEFYQVQEAKARDVEQKVLRPMQQMVDTKMLGELGVVGCTVTVTALVMLTDEECLKLDRGARTAVLRQSFLPDLALLGARTLSDKELQEIEQNERLIAMEEARLQAEAKARLIAEAEARKKAEEEMAKLLQKKDAIIGKVQQLKGSGQLKVDDLDFLFSVPLADAISAPLELVGVCLNKSNAEAFANSSLVPKLSSATEKIPGLPSDGRFLVACQKAAAAFAQHGAVSAASALCSLMVVGALRTGGAALRQFGPCIEAVHAAGGSLTPASFGAVAAVWSEAAVDNKAALGNAVSCMAPSARALLAADVESAFGTTAVRAALPVVLSSRPCDASDVEFVIAWAGSCDGGYLEEATTTALATVVAASRHVPVAEECAAGYRRLADLTVPWTSEAAKKMVDTADGCGASGSAVVEPLLSRLRSQ